mgnify:CR=1 FL=1
MITKKQKLVLDFIIDYTNKNGESPTQREIKEKFQLKSFGSVQRYLKYLINAGELENNWNARRGLKAPIASNNSSQEYEIPVLGSIAAGQPIEAIETPDETVTLPSHLRSGSGPHFALKVKGDSMIEAGILDQDLAIIKSSNSARKGQIVAAVVENEATLKTFIPHVDKIELKPENKEYTSIIVNEGEAYIAGILVGIIRAY